MLGIVHGYGLGGSGSNLWTREAVSALCAAGETVHLVCQESNPQRFDFVSELVTYDEAGEARTEFSREARGPGRCIVHTPVLRILPTYVRPGATSRYVRSILDLDDTDIEDYLERNVRVLRRVSREHGVRAWHVNHVVLLAEALRRLHEQDGVRYAVMPHGSALEYVVRHDDRMREVARRALAAAGRIFSLNQEIRERLARYFPDLDLEHKTTTVRVGVDTERFRPVPRERRTESVAVLAAALRDAPRGRSQDHGRLLAEALEAATDHASFRAMLGPAADYPANPDAELEHALDAVDWERERIVAFVGRLIPAKGVAALLAAFPLVLERHPDTRLLLVGGGWLREYLEAFRLALARGEGDRARAILDWAEERDTEITAPSATTFLQVLHSRRELDRYAATAARLLRPDRVLFTGFLEHHLLAHVLPLADVAVFPSAVAEASPLVIPEAAACGCLPMGTYFAGMRHSLDSLAPRLPAHLRPLMRLRPEPEHTAFDIASHVIQTLDGEHPDAAAALRAAAVEEYDWRRIALLITRELEAISA
jgi:glycosyltransferase involved in cell wall biosynthesis